MKVSKAKAGYHKDAAECEVCKWFRPPHACSMVAGEISPDGVCEKYFERKSRTIASERE